MRVTGQRKGNQMKIRLICPSRVNALSGECEVTKDEANRLLLLGVAEAIEEKETPEKVKKTTRKK